MSRRAIGSMLTEKERVFVGEYMIDFNGTRAAIRAKFKGRSAGVTACRVLKKPEVQAAIAEQQAARMKRLSISADAVLAELWQIARANLIDCMPLDKDGAPTADLRNADRDKASALSEITVDFGDGHGTGERVARRIRYKLHNKLDAIAQVTKYCGLFEEQPDAEPPAEEAAEAPQHSNRQVARAILEVFRSAQEEGDDEDENENENEGEA